MNASSAEYLERLHCASLSYGEYEFPDATLSEIDVENPYYDGGDGIPQGIRSNVRMFIQTSIRPTPAVVDPPFTLTPKRTPGRRLSCSPSSHTQSRQPSPVKIKDTDKSSTLSRAALSTITSTCHHHHDDASDLHETLMRHPQQLETMYSLLPSEKRRYGKAIQEAHIRRSSLFVGPLGAYRDDDGKHEVFRPVPPKCDRDSCHHMYDEVAHTIHDPGWSPHRALQKREQMQFHQHTAAPTSGMTVRHHGI